MKKNQFGYVILEVLLAFTIFGMALFALVAFQTNLFRERGVVNQENAALALAQNKMDSFRAYTALTTTTGYFAYSDIVSSTAAEISTGVGATYSMTWTVTDATAPTRKAVNVVVTWTDPNGTSHSVSTNGVIASINPTDTAKVSENIS